MGSFSNSKSAENSKNIRVGRYGGVVLKAEIYEKKENIRVGEYGGVVFKVEFS